MFIIPMRGLSVSVQPPHEASQKSSSVWPMKCGSAGEPSAGAAAVDICSEHSWPPSMMLWQLGVM